MGIRLSNKNEEYSAKNYALFERLRNSTDKKEIADIKNELYNLNYPLIKIGALWNLKYFRGDFEEAMLCAEEAFAKAIYYFQHDYIGKYGENTGFANYYFNTAKSVAVWEIGRNKSVNADLDLDSPITVDEADTLIDFISADVDIENEINTNMIVSSVRNALKDLPLDQKDILYRRYVEKMSMASIAKDKNVTKQRIEQILRKTEYRFVRTLRDDECFKSVYEEYVGKKNEKDFKYGEKPTKITDMSTLFEELYNVGAMDNILKYELNIDASSDDIKCM